MNRTIALSLVIAAAATTPSAAQDTAEITGYTPEQCPPCAGWNEPTEPFPIHGNAWWVGTRGLGAVLITSDSGHVLIDGGLPESAPRILESIRTLGFSPDDVKAIVNSHPHYDHAGGIAALQRATGAEVLALADAAAALRTGRLTEQDPQRDTALAYPAVADVRVVADGDTIRVGDLAVVAHSTPGHSPGGTTWSWRSCASGRCLDLVYADSQTPVSDDGFRFSEGDRVSRFERGLAAIESLPCDILVTPHPGASAFWARVEARGAGEGDALVDPSACRRYAERYRQRLDVRLDRERGGGDGP